MPMVIDKPYENGSISLISHFSRADSGLIGQKAHFGDYSGKAGK